MQQASRCGIAVIYGLLCHLLFVAGVGTMIFQMYFGLSRCFGTLPVPANWLVNAMLLLQFPLSHSYLLSQPGRRLLARLAPGDFGVDLSTTTFVIVASAQILALFVFWTPSGVILWQAQGGVLWILTGLYAASWLLLGKAILDAGLSLQTGWLGWWAVFRNRRPAYPGMPTRGLFRLCRQPIYLAFICTLWTVPLWTLDQLLIAIGLTAYCIVGPLFKEARFVRIFGQRFVDYQMTRPYILPASRPALQPPKRNDLTIYDSFADHWWDGSQRWLRTLQNLVPARLSHFDKFADWRGRTVLDLGCGGGFMAEALALRGANVIGVDPAEHAIAIARRHAAEQGLPIVYLRGSGEMLPVAAASMEFVVCVDVLEHVSDLVQVIDEIRRAA